MFFNEPNNSLKYARIEEEYRFLLKSIPEELLRNGKYIRIFDHYIPGTRLRLRRMESHQGNILFMKLGQKYQTADYKAHQTIIPK